MGLTCCLAQIGTNLNSAAKQHPRLLCVIPVGLEGQVKAMQIC